MESMSARLRLLDLQIVDARGLPIGRVDDVELALGQDPGPSGDRTRDGVRVVALACGQRALGRRLGGTLGQLLEATAARLDRSGDSADRPDRLSGVTRISAASVHAVSSTVELRCSLAELPEVAGLERWLATHLIARIPGAGEPVEDRGIRTEDPVAGGLLLSRLLAAPVHDWRGEPCGIVHDVRLRRGAAAGETALGPVIGLVVGPGDSRSRLAHAWGYAEGASRGPGVLRRLLGPDAAASRVVPVSDVLSWEPAITVSGPLDQHPLLVPQERP